LPVATAEVALKDVTGPHKSSAASSNRYIKGRSAYSASTDDQAHPSPEIIGTEIYRRIGPRMGHAV
jgi:hypothetical protein